MAFNRRAAIFIAPVAIGALFSFTLSCGVADQADQAAGGDEEALFVIFKTLSHAQSLAGTSAISTPLPAILASTADTADVMLEDMDRRLTAKVEEDKLILNEQMAILESWNYEEIPQIRRLVDSLIANAETIDSNRAKQHSIIVEHKAKAQTFTYDFNWKLDAALGTSLDDQFHEVISQYEGSSDLEKENFIRYHHMYNLLSSMRSAVIRLQIASTLAHPDQLRMIEDEYNANVQRIRYSIDYLSENHVPHMRKDDLVASSEFIKAGMGEENIFDVLAMRQKVFTKERQLAAANVKIIGDLTEKLNELAEKLDA